MSPTPPKRPNLSSGSEKTTDSETTRTKSSKSPTLQAFQSFDESLAQFRIRVETKIDHIGFDNVDGMKASLEVLDKKCNRMKEHFEGFSSHLDTAIQDYETKKPTDLAADANSLISPEDSARNRSSLYKRNQTIEDLFAALNISISKIFLAIQKKIDKSIYEDYSSSLEKKLKNLKKMCEVNSKILEEIGQIIKKAIDANEKKREQPSDTSESYPFATHASNEFLTVIAEHLRSHINH